MLGISKWLTVTVKQFMRQGIRVEQIEYFRIKSFQSVDDEYGKDYGYYNEDSVGEAKVKAEPYHTKIGINQKTKSTNHQNQ